MAGTVRSLFSLFGEKFLSVPVEARQIGPVGLVTVPSVIARCEFADDTEKAKLYPRALATMSLYGTAD